MGTTIRVGCVHSRWSPFSNSFPPLHTSRISAKRTMTDYWEPSDEEEPRTGGLGKREKRLARNRESARKCRKKRKAFVNEMAEKVQALTEDNAILELENRRLQELVRQLQSGASAAPEPS